MCVPKANEEKQRQGQNQGASHFQQPLLAVVQTERALRMWYKW
jgi:hypothetical protein